MALDKHTFPPGGWKFRQACTGWENPMPMAFTFERTVEEIIRHRQKNPAITQKNNLATDFASVSDELEAYTMKRLGMSESPKLTPLRGVARRAGAVVAAVRNLGVGAQNLLAWSDSGKVVPQDVADSRATICASGSPDGRCPMNGSGDWKTIFTEPAAELIKNQLAAKNSMKLATRWDQSLGVCEACACPLQLKVWAPLDYALRKMSKETKDKLPDWCWMKIGK